MFYVSPRRSDFQGSRNSSEYSRDLALSISETKVMTAAASHPIHNCRKRDIGWQTGFLTLLAFRWCCFLACCRPDLKVQNSQCSFQFLPHPSSVYLKGNSLPWATSFFCFRIQWKMMLRAAVDLPSIWQRNSKIQVISEPKSVQKSVSLLHKVIESSGLLHYQAEQSTGPVDFISIALPLIFRYECHILSQGSRGLCILSSTLLYATEFS